MNIVNILFFIIGIILIVISLVIYKTKSLNIFEAHEELKQYNEKKLLNWITISFALTGIVISVTSILTRAYEFINSAIVFGVCICILALLVGVGCSIYEEK